MDLAAMEKAVLLTAKLQARPVLYRGTAKANSMPYRSPGPGEYYECTEGTRSNPVTFLHFPGEKGRPVSASNGDYLVFNASLGYWERHRNIQGSFAEKFKGMAPLGAVPVSDLYPGDFYIAGDTGTYTAFLDSSGQPLEANVGNQLMWDRSWYVIPIGGGEFLDGILEWYNNGYRPYEARRAGAFYSNPDSNPPVSLNVLGYDGILYVTQLFDNSGRIASREWVEQRLTEFGSQIKHEHVQEVPMATWTIVHSLEKVFNVRVKTSNGTEIFAAVEDTAPDTVTIRFSAPMSGTAYLL